MSHTSKMFLFIITYVVSLNHIGYAFPNIFVYDEEYIISILAAMWVLLALFFLRLPNLSTPINMKFNNLFVCLFGQLFKFELALSNLKFCIGYSTFYSFYKKRLSFFCNIWALKKYKFEKKNIEIEILNFFFSNLYFFNLFQKNLISGLLLYKTDVPKFFLKNNLNLHLYI